MLPHNVEMVKKYRDEPFAVVGVNSDARGRSGLADIVKEHHLNYPSAVAGADLGAIETSYRVMTHPTVFLIDRSGVVRRRFQGFVAPEVMTGEVEKLLKEQ